jgi:hypothetical protein
MMNCTSVAKASCSHAGSMIPNIGSRSGALSTTAAAMRHVSRLKRRSSAATIAWSRSTSPVTSSAS